jgi:serine/threonine protein kinase
MTPGPALPYGAVPAEHLMGRRLTGGWKVIESVATSGTGGAFSICYRVEHDDGRMGFLKALNFQAASHGPGTLPDRLKRFLDAYIFERDLLRDCGTRRLSRVIQLLDHGEIVLGPRLEDTVPYLILEQADGDARRFREAMKQIDCAWVFRTMKHVCLGLEQLHGVNAAHQDLKPSNVLTQSDGHEMKLGDLGRADRQGAIGPWSDWEVPGARSYAPPEQLYLAFGRTWEERKAGDLYLAGSLGAQLFIGHNMTALMQQKLPLDARAGVWSGSYADVVPMLEHAHAHVLAALNSILLSEVPDAALADPYVTAVAQMTQPDPSKRGHPRDRRSKTSSFALRRFVSRFNELATRTELALRRGAIG